ncbi:MAG: hypothetical protein HQK52_08100 [Oligoflexia bacterium]|nr:hypothetical protein [Oligoflexia bacterium]
MIFKKIMNCVFFLCIYSQFAVKVFADTTVSITPQEILDAQLKCNQSILDKYKGFTSIELDNQPAKFQLAKNRIIIVGNIQLKDRVVDSKLLKNGYLRLYELSYRIFENSFNDSKGVPVFTNDVSCDDSENIIKTAYSMEILAKSRIQDSFAEDDFYMSRKGNNFLIETAIEGDNYYSMYPGIDQKGKIIDNSKSGFVCMVKAEEFIKDQNSIDINKLCEGQPQSKKDLMKWALNNLHEFYKSKYPEWKKTAKPDRK